MAVAETTIVAATIEIITSVPASVKPPSRRVAKEGRVKEKETSRGREIGRSYRWDRAGQITILAMPLSSFVVCRQFVRDTTSCRDSLYDRSFSCSCEFNTRRMSCRAGYCDVSNCEIVGFCWLKNLTCSIMCLWNFCLYIKINLFFKIIFYNNIALVEFKNYHWKKNLAIIANLMLYITEHYFW